MSMGYVRGRDVQREMFRSRFHNLKTADFKPYIFIACHWTQGMKWRSLTWPHDQSLPGGRGVGAGSESFRRPVWIVSPRHEEHNNGADTCYDYNKWGGAVVRRYRTAQRSPLYTIHERYVLIPHNNVFPQRHSARTSMKLSYPYHHTDIRVHKIHSKFTAQSINKQ